MSRDSEWGERRRRTAELVVALLDGTITTDEYWRRLDAETGSGNEELDKLLHLIEHEPARSRLLGLRAPEHAEYVAQVHGLAERLTRQAEQGPNHPRHNYPLQVTGAMFKEAIVFTACRARRDSGHPSPAETDART